MRVTARPGETFLDRMIALVEGAKRQKTPNEIALDILLAALTLVFLLRRRDACRSSPPGPRHRGPVIYLAALFVTLIPTTIGGLLSAIGIAGMDRLVKANVVAKSGRAVEAGRRRRRAAARQDRHHHLRQPHGGPPCTACRCPGPSERASRGRLPRASLADETPEGKSASSSSARRAASSASRPTAAEAGMRTFVPFTAQTRMSGVDLADGSVHPQGRLRRRASWSGRQAAEPASTHRPRDRHRRGGTPLVVAARDGRILGVGAPQGHREARHPRALRRAAPHGHPHGDGHRRQPAAPRRRSPRRPASTTSIAEATPEDKLDLHPPRAVRGRSAGRDDRRRHQRRAGARPGRRRRRHEHGHPRRQGGRQSWSTSTPTRPSSSRSCSIGKQLLITRGALTTFSDRQRPRQVLRHPASAVRHRCIPSLAAPQRHGPRPRRSRRSSPRSSSTRSSSSR
jgi:K+-transporting ATPase ATPase B chain